MKCPRIVSMVNMELRIGQIWELPSISTGDDLGPWEIVAIGPELFTVRDLNAESELVTQTHNFGTVFATGGRRGANRLLHFGDDK